MLENIAWILIVSSYNDKYQWESLASIYQILLVSFSNLPLVIDNSQKDIVKEI